MRESVQRPNQIAFTDRMGASSYPAQQHRQRSCGARSQGLGHFTRVLFFSAFLIAGSLDAMAAMAPPPSLAGTISESTLVATVKINSVRRAGDYEIAMATVIQSLKGTKAGKTLTIETLATLAETARYEAGEECLVFLGRRGSHFDTPRGMFGRYVIRDQKVFRWIVGRRRPADLPLVEVVSEIRRAIKKDDNIHP